MMDSTISVYACVCMYAFIQVSRSVKSVSNTFNPDTATKGILILKITMSLPTF